MYEGCYSIVLTLGEMSTEEIWDRTIYPEKKSCLFGMLVNLYFKYKGQNF